MEEARALKAMQKEEKLVKKKLYKGEDDWRWRLMYEEGGDEVDKSWEADETWK